MRAGGAGAGGRNLNGRRVRLLSPTQLLSESIIPKRQIPLAVPGEILLQEFLKPLGVIQYRLAKEIGVPQRRIGEIAAGKRTITAARLGVYFSIEAEFWGDPTREWSSDEPNNTRPERVMSRSRSAARRSGTR